MQTLDSRTPEFTLFQCYLMGILGAPSEITHIKYLVMCLVPVDQQMTSARMKVIGHEKGNVTFVSLGNN